MDLDYTLIDLFFEHLQNRSYLLDKIWFIENIQYQSPFVLYAFYAFVSTQPPSLTEITYNNGLPYYEMALSLLSHALAHPSTFVVLGLLWMGVSAAGWHLNSLFKIKYIFRSRKTSCSCLCFHGTENVRFSRN